MCYLTIKEHLLKKEIKTITINLPEEVELGEVKMIIAVSLFEQGILSSGQAAELGEISRRDFRRIRQIWGLYLWRR